MEGNVPYGRKYIEGSVRGCFVKIKDKRTCLLPVHAYSYRLSCCCNYTCSSSMINMDAVISFTCVVGTVHVLAS